MGLLPTDSKPQSDPFALPAEARFADGTALLPPCLSFQTT